jgi:hypothetical protein
MFSKIRHASQVLSSVPKNPREEPDIVFEEQAPEEISFISKMIGGLVEIYILVVVVGIIGAPVFSKFVPVHADTTTKTAILAVVLSLTLHQMWNGINESVRKRLKIGEKIAPFFGHKIVRAMKILRS